MLDIVQSVENARKALNIPAKRLCADALVSASRYSRAKSGELVLTPDECNRLVSSVKGFRLRHEDIVRRARHELEALKQGDAA